MSVKTIQAKSHLQTKKVFWVLFLGSKGASSRIRIISELRNKPSNRHQLSTELGIDYKVIQHHLKILERDNLVKTIGSKSKNKYGVIYCVSELFEHDENVFDEIVNKFKKHTLFKSKEMRI